MSIRMMSILPTPEEIKAEFPLKDNLIERKKAFDKEVSSIIDGSSSKFLLIIGPCSADNEDSVILTKKFSNNFFPSVE